MADEIDPEDAEGTLTNNFGVMPGKPPTKLDLPLTMGQIASGLMDARTNLAKSRSDKSEKWLAIAAALGQPTRTGTIGETASNVAGAVGKYKAEQRAEEQKNLADRIGIDTKLYDILSTNETNQSRYAAQLATAQAKAADEGLVQTGQLEMGGRHYVTMLATKGPNAGKAYRALLEDAKILGVLPAPPLQAAANTKTPITPVTPQPTTLQKVGGVNLPTQPLTTLQVAAGVKPPVTPPVKTEKPTFMGQDSKRHAVGDPPYEGRDGYMYRMAEDGDEIKVSAQPSEAFEARQKRTEAQVTSEAAASKPAPADHTAFNAERTAVKSLNQSSGSIKRALEVNNLAFDGPLGGLATGAARLTGRNEAELKATAVMSAALNEATLANLKASLGANPTEGERKYLDDMFASAKSAATKAEREAKLTEIQTWITNRLAAASDTVKAYQQQFPSYFDPNYIDAVKQARSAIAKGAPRDAVIQRLKEQGLAPPGDL